MEQKVLIIVVVFVALLLILHLIRQFVRPSSAASTALGFGHPLSHADEVDPETQRQRLEETAALAARQAAITKKFDTDNNIA